LLLEIKFVVPVRSAKGVFAMVEMLYLII